MFSFSQSRILEKKSSKIHGNLITIHEIVENETICEKLAQAYPMPMHEKKHSRD